MRKQIIDDYLFNLYIKEGVTICFDEIMTKIEKAKQEKLNWHIESIYPIKEVIKDGKIISYYTKTNPKNRNHSGKISAKTKEDLETKLLLYYYNLTVKDYTLQEIITLIVEDYYKNNQSATGDTHRQNFSRCFPNLANVKPKELTPKMIDSALIALINKGIKAKAFSKATSTLNKINDYCTRNGISCIDIRSAIDEFKRYELTGRHKFIQDSRQHRNLSFDRKETIALLHYSLANPCYKSLFIALILTTGCRAGELLCMSYNNIDLENRIFFVAETEDSKSHIVRPYTKSNDAREVYLNGDAMRFLKQLLALREKDSHPTDYLFLNPASPDGKLHLRAVDDFLRRLQVKLKFDRQKECRSLHDGRRTYASLQYLNGVDVMLIQKQLGHKSTTQTWDYIKDIVDANTRAGKLEMGCLMN